MRGVFVKYGHHIRSLSAYGFITIICVQAVGNCTHLRTLAVAGSYERQRFQEAHSLWEPFRYDDIRIEAQALPKTFISPNPQLEGLRFGKNFSSLRLGLQDGFILKTLTSLRNLTKLDTYFLGEGFDFKAVLEELPQVKHFAVGVANLSVPRFHRPFPHFRTMRISSSLELSHLLLLIDNIPNLDQLWIRGFQQPWESDEYTSKTCIPVS
ncbi:hypothetical protein BGZ96_005550 [Linnemannia gamsii]|uniref:Uncharacterized protein n=1 Tax=Linnemannia gamsii TaxID=64522 RepID=A0ABQ7K4M1_9FUNG|nr:hypothetical protein BGZ96_005550 [Linnemannia gamsii]